ncbi:PREDICTED: uncharacterized protein LOC108367936 isoform X1 [Rhagoletis zephyria]|uniref:uncharacterized protein LOC108367936 isoform X1 n=1 Tax=Rhagoletis zephyria TaxID=28612 RepID=UPI00081121B1|nr:PREDICTED: uncharacterized protein LOC108367936 isoform X1 [Rhagoletis zephyria]
MAPSLSRDCLCDTASSSDANPPARTRNSATAPLPAASAYTNVQRGRRLDGRFYANVVIEGMSVRALVDTGATVTYVDKTVRKHLEKSMIRPRLSHRNVQLADQTCISSSYTYSVNIKYSGRATTTLVSVIPNLAERIILGMEFLRKRGITIMLDGQQLAAANLRKPDTPAKLCATTEREHLREEQKRTEFLRNHRKLSGRIIRPSTTAGRMNTPKCNQPAKQWTGPRNTTVTTTIQSHAVVSEQAACSSGRITNHHRKLTRGDDATTRSQQPTNNRCQRRARKRRHSAKHRPSEPPRNTPRRPQPRDLI